MSSSLPLSKVLTGLVAFASPALAFGDCPASAVDINAAISTAEDAFARMDERAFPAAVDEVEARLACTDEILARPDLAALHQVEGLQRFLGHDREGALQAFSAARAADPKTPLPDAVAPEGHPLRALYASAPTDGATLTVAAPPAGYLLFDGRRGLARPAQQPTVLQGVAPDGAIWVSAYLWPTDPLPPWPDTLVAEATAHPNRRRNAVVVLGAFALGSAATSASLYAAGASARTEYEDLSTDVDALGSLRSRVNTFQALSWGAGGLALVGGASAALIAVGGDR